MRIVITGGGTGGHIIPNIAIIKELKGEDVLYIGGSGNLEEKIMQEKGIPFSGICVGKFRRYFDLRNVLDFFKIPIGIFQAYFILRKFRPKVVFAKGGYVSVPIIFASALLKIPLILHESDITPGLATRIGGRFATTVLLSFQESEKYFPGKHTIVTGNPVRSEIFLGKKEEGYRLTGFSPNKPVVLVIGGSTGSRFLNELVWDSIREIRSICQIVHLTGPEKEETDRKVFPGYKSFPYLDKELPHMYAISDLIVSRAGSGSLFEILALKKPNILIPLPKSASRGEQIENAKLFKSKGWSEVLFQEDLTGERFSESIRKMLENKEKMIMMRRLMENLKPEGIAWQIAQIIKR